MRHTVLKHPRYDGRRENFSMGDYGIADALNFLYRHVRIGSEGQVIGLETLVNEAVDGSMNLAAHGLNDHAIDGIVVPLACCLKRLQTGDVSLLCLLAHLQQLIGETTHC